MGRICQRSEKNKRNFFLIMMAMVLFCILGRIIKLAICLIDDSNSQRKFVYNMFTENLPILFKMIFVTQYCKYKLNTYYIATYKRASAWVRWGLVMLELYICLDYLVITVSGCSAMEERDWVLIESITQLFFVTFMMTFSLFLFIILYR